MRHLWRRFRSGTATGVVGLITLLAGCALSRGADLFRDDFSRFPARLADAAARPAQRRDPGIPLPAAPRRAAGAVGQRDLPPRCLGRRRRGRAAYLEQHTVNDQAG